MIGKACKSLTPYYDRESNSQRVKSRPCLVIGQADSGDYVVLPISSVSDKSKVNAQYDIYLDCSVYTFLRKDSYLRTHKQTVVNIKQLKDPFADFKVDYKDTFLEALGKVEKFQKELIDNAL